jgi:peptidoglycan/LPS O-acetylase OafA/YrhL
MRNATSELNYRPDIDGLRAIAVLSVILFHIDKTLIPGGFVGVDIFFVISGFLISLNILKDLERGRFSITDFYRRRVKRIAPPMLIVVWVTLVAAQFFLLPQDAEPTAESGLWSLLSLANVYFWLHQDTSYFAAASSEIPLLHLWSLGVEEQFYIFWPLILMAFYRPSRARLFFWIAAIVGIGSFLMGEILFSSAPTFAYYMLPTRFGELLMGGLVAFFVMRNLGAHFPKKLVAPTAVVGMLLIGFSFFLLSERQVFPGLRAIPPTLGAGLLIFAGHCSNNFISRFLAVGPLVWVGLISYSAYLWHWPLLAFYRYGHREIGLVAGSVIFALTLLLAWLTYRFVEGPSRRSKASTFQVLLRQFAIPAGALAVFALAAMKVDGYGLRWFSSEYKNQANALRQETLPAYSYKYVCQRQKLTLADTNDPDCVVGGDSSAAPVAILWGDSNAAHYIGMIGAFAKKEKFRFRNLAAAACPPLLSDPTPYVTATRLADCQESATLAKQAIGPFTTIIISADWSAYQRRSGDFLQTFFDTVNTLEKSGKHIILIGQIPIFQTYDRRCEEKALSYPALDCPTFSATLDTDVKQTNEKLRTFAASKSNVEYFDSAHYLCHQDRCSPFDAKGRPIYYDATHLSMSASWKLGETILQQYGVPKIFSLAISPKASP